MDFFQAMRIAAGGLTAQRMRMNVIAENMANAETTRTQEGGPYRPGRVVLEAAAVSDSFEDVLGRTDVEESAQTVRVAGVERDAGPPRVVHDPGHPDADADGNVAMPDISMLEEMTDMIGASRSYEANLFMLRTLRGLADRALNLGRG